ncbi:hypothetical protein EVG20_g6831 [Dentipellis fragilis]|uniref:F-box domain-containing protein n=1 Tax=Dentipellis fragilis TaxID=205917 RepID=A0A4Y9YHP6_9AGAM|nr:hypothetical protein EVG20_g6831 [Dentipellis fragilis]
MDQASPQAFGSLRSPAGIARLPNELLALIFRELVDVDRPRHVPVPRGDPPAPVARWLGWLHVTHVCRHWRRVALETATLWCKINLNVGHTWAHEMIIRSQRAPLAINYFAEYDVAGDNIRQDISGHISHISDLKITGYSEFFLNGLLPHLVEPAPILTSLSLSSQSRLSQFFTNLTGLYISVDAEGFADFGPSIVYPAMTELLDALDRMPHLEDLELLGILPASGLQGPLTSSRRSVLLPDLGTLQLSGPFLDCAALVLHHLEYPLTTAVKISCICDISLVHETDAIIPMITRYTQARRPRYVEVTTRENENDEPWVSVLTSLRTSADVYLPDLPGQFSMDWTHPDHEDDWTHALCLLRTFFEVAMLDDVHTLVVDGPVDDEQWRSIIGDSCVGATEVSVSWDGVPGLLSVLRAANAGTPANAFPNIRTLVISEGPSPSHQHEGPVWEEVMETLAEAKSAWYAYSDVRCQFVDAQS